MKYGPSRTEHKWRIVAGIAVFAFMLFAVWMRGVSGIAWIEVVALTTIFCGITIGWSGWHLFKGSKDE
ncbi:hypothetical protein [Algirhabdus cladophorae]|uniref:hypothetical protein n=1 Tax=Algirhabdus cladophorae TaxID=3377108 RepID=UPI003B84512D